MRDHCNPGDMINQRTVKFFMPFAAAAALIIFFAAAVHAQIIDDGRRRHETLTPSSAGVQNLQPADSWYRVDVAGLYVGYVHMNLKVSGGKAVYTERVRLKYKTYYDTQDFVVTMEQGTLKPSKVTIFKEGRYYKAYRKIQKTFVFDWDARKILIIVGEGPNARSRSIAMEQNAVYTPHWFYALHKRELLKPGVEYQFKTLDFDFERYITLGVTVLAETKKDVFELFLDLPDAYGTAVDVRYWISPKTIALPNGDFLRKEWIGEFMDQPLTMVKTTKAKATKQEPDSKKSTKKK